MIAPTNKRPLGYLDQTNDPRGLHKTNDLWDFPISAEEMAKRMTMVMPDILKKIIE